MSCSGNPLANAQRNRRYPTLPQRPLRSKPMTHEATDNPAGDFALPPGSGESPTAIEPRSNKVTRSTKAVREAAAYLRSCCIHLPKFRLVASDEGRLYGGSFVAVSGTSPLVNIGDYPTAFLRNWFAMHELGHLLWASHRPLRWKSFRKEFGDPPPAGYGDLARVEAWKTPGTWKLSWRPGAPRPEGQPSWYGARAGGQERFCELLGFMWAHGDFSEPPPADLAGLWDCCWHQGLSRMV